VPLTFSRDTFAADPDKLGGAGYPVRDRASSSDIATSERAGCKAVIGQRLKQSGMRWTVSGADSIITLRCAEASSRRAAISGNRHHQIGTA